MISEGKLGEFKTLTVENDKVRFKIVPQVGGRIVEYTLKSSGHNQLFSDYEAFTSYKPGETMTRTVMYRAGGHEDTIKETGHWNWPNDFEQEPYTLEVMVDSPELATIRLTAEKGSVKIERVHTLRKGSTTLSHELTVTNVSDKPIEMMLRHRVATQAGGQARRTDKITYPGASGIVCKKFFPDNIWMDFLLADGWVCASDPVARETFLLTSAFENLSNGGIWFDKLNYYNLEFFGKKQMVPAGQSTTLKTQWHIFSDVPLITFATKDLLGFFEGAMGDDHQFTLNTGIIALKEFGKVAINGIFYNGPNIIDDFQQEMETVFLSNRTSSLTKKLFSPVDEIHAKFKINDMAEVSLIVPLIDTSPPEPIVLKPLTNQPFRYCLQDNSDYQLWIESTSGVVLPDEVFNDSKPPRNVIELEVLPNEYEGFQLAIRPKENDIKSIEPIFENLREVTTEATLSANSFSFYRGETILVETENRRMYDPLVPNAAVNASEEQNAMLFIELHCDDMQLPGIYEGKIKLHSVEQDFSPITIRVKVRAYQMPHARSIDTAFWVWKTWNTRKHKNTKVWHQLARYRLSPGWLRAGHLTTSEDAEFIDVKGKAKPGKVISVWNEEAKQWCIEGYHHCQINRISTGYNIWGYADTWDWKHSLVRNTRAAAGWLDENGFLQDSYYQIVDEPLASRFAQLKQVIKLFRQGNPDYTIMCTMPINPDMYGYIDMWHVPWGALEPEVAKQRQQLGEKVWLYNALPKITGIGKLGRLIGWFCWKYNLDGYMHFAVDYPDSHTILNPWQSTGSHWTLFFYPTVKTWDPELPVWQNYAKWDWSIPSIRLMQIRDGFEDYEYMKMLQKWIHLAKRHNKNEQDLELITQAEQLLGIQDHFVGDFISFTENPEDMMVARKRIGDMIDKLRYMLTGKQF